MKVDKKFLFSLFHAVTAVCMASFLLYIFYVDKKLEEDHYAEKETPVDTADSFRSDSDADNIRLYLINPFNKEGVYSSETTEMLSKYKTGMLSDEALKRFKKLYAQVAKAFNVCHPSGSFPGWLLKCQDENPVEYAVLVNNVDLYMQTRKEENDLILSYYNRKANSKKMFDRLEAEFFDACVEMGLAGELSSSDFDPKSSMTSSDLIDICHRASDVLSEDDINKIACKVLNLPEEYLSPNGENVPFFSYSDFVFNFLLPGRAPKLANKKKSVQDTHYLKGEQGKDGMGLLEAILPDFDVYYGSLGDSNGKGFYADFYTPSMEPAQVYMAIYKAVDILLNSEDFNKLTTDGCIPSVFSLGLDKNDGNFAYSVCLPTKVIEKINALPEEDAKYLRAKIARKVSVLLTVELLQGGVLISGEVAKVLSTSNEDIARLAKENSEYMKRLAESYKRMIDVTYARKLEDVLQLAYDLAENYQEEVSSVDAGTQKISEKINSAQKMMLLDN